MAAKEQKAELLSPEQLQANMQTLTTSMADMASIMKQMMDMQRSNAAHPASEGGASQNVTPLTVQSGPSIDSLERAIRPFIFDGELNTFGE